MTNSNQNGNSGDRLDRIESVLERITDRLAQVSEAGQQTDARGWSVSALVLNASQRIASTRSVKVVSGRMRMLERIAAAVSTS